MFRIFESNRLYLRSFARFLYYVLRDNRPTFNGRHGADRLSLDQDARRGAGPLQRLVLQRRLTAIATSPQRYR